MKLSDKIKVSVVVPVYNTEPYLERCLNSLVGQTLPDMEILVVNDGSEDHSQQIIDRFAARYPQKIRAFQKPNGGLSDARNYGISHCRGAYVGFVDSDDYVDADMYASMYREAEKQNADMVVCDYVKEYKNSARIVCAGNYESPRDMLLGGLAAAWNKIYRTDLIRSNGLRFPKGLIYEDTEFFCKLIPLVKKCGYAAKPFVHYVQRSGSIANTQGQKTAMIFQIFDNIRAWYIQNGYYRIFGEELDYFTVRVLLGSSMERICRCSDSQIRRDLLRQTAEYLDRQLPGWHKNKYLRDRSDLRSIYMRNVRRWNIRPIGCLLSVYFQKTEKKLQSQ